MMLNQIFTDKIGLHNNTNIQRNISYENIRIKRRYFNCNTYVFTLNE